MIATPEVETRAVYGVVWNGHTQPLSDYSSLEEATKVAKICHGSVLVRYETRTGWGPL
jgi:hypothetical protein